jgi:predicted RNA methylase
MKNMGPEEIRARLRAGELVPDADFDACLPAFVRAPSRRHWTQVEVVVSAARWLKEYGVRSVLDVGSGAGKFCVVGALSSAMSFTGLETREHLVVAARELSLRFGVARKVRFVSGGLDALDFRAFDALYFYNPFGEHSYPKRLRIDETIVLNLARQQEHIATAERLLRQMPKGTYLVTYNGFGGKVPDSFELLRARHTGASMLRLWRKSRVRARGGPWLELEDTTVWAS